MKEKNFYLTVYQFSQGAKGCKKLLADFLLRSSTEAALMTIEDIAEVIEASAGTVSRIVRQMGFENFAQMQQLMRKELLKTLSPAGRLQKLPSSLTFQDSLAQDKENLTVLESLNSDAHFLTAAKHLARAPAVYIFGLRSSYAAAYFLSVCLEQVRQNVYVMDRSMGKLPEQIKSFKKNDLVAIFSFPRYLREPIAVTEHARNAQCHVLSFSDSTLSPAALLSDIALATPFVSTSFFNSSTALFALLNALLTQTMLELGSDGRKELERFESIQNMVSNFSHLEV